VARAGRSVSPPSMNRRNVPVWETLPHPGPLPVAAPLAKGEGELFADGWR
jgi:hypothetical protein